MILLGKGDAAAAKRRLLERAGARVVGEGETAALAIVADGDDAAVARLKARGILVNATDRPELCDFTLPAIVDRAPVLIAIGTGGASAGLAKALRQRIETLLPARLGRLADTLFAARATLRARWPEPAARRHAIDAALAEGGPLDPFADGDVATWLAGQAATAVGPAEAAPIALRLRSPDPDDLTLREARLMGRADRVYHRPDIPASILDRARADAVRFPCAAPPASAPGLALDIGWEGR